MACNGSSELPSENPTFPPSTDSRDPSSTDSSRLPTEHRTKCRSRSSPWSKSRQSYRNGKDEENDEGGFKFRDKIFHSQNVLLGSRKREC